MKNLLLIFITMILICLAGCAVMPVPTVYAEITQVETEPTQVEVVNPLTISPPPAPEAPGEILMSGITDTEATISWSPVAGATQYSIFMNGVRWTGAVSPGVEVRGLQPYTIYDVHVTAANGGGESGPSPTVNFITMPPVPVAPPTPTVTNVTGDSALVQWEPLPPWQYIQAYRVYVDGTAVADIPPQEGTQTANLTNLTSGSHAVYVSGVNDNREGPPSPPTYFAVSAIAAPTGLKMTNHSQDAIWFRWDTVTGADRYIVNVNGQLIGETKNTEHIISALQAGQSYELEVIAVLSDGNRSQAAVMQAQTLPAPDMVTKETYLQAIFSYVPDMAPGIIMIFAVGGAFAVARAAKQPFTRKVLLKLWR